MAAYDGLCQPPAAAGRAQAADLRREFRAGGQGRSDRRKIARAAGLMMRKSHKTRRTNPGPATLHPNLSGERFL